MRAADIPYTPGDTLDQQRWLYRTLRAAGVPLERKALFGKYREAFPGDDRFNDALVSLWRRGYLRYEHREVTRPVRIERDDGSLYEGPGKFQDQFLLLRDNLKNSGREPVNANTHSEGFYGNSYYQDHSR